MIDLNEGSFVVRIPTHRKKVLINLISVYLPIQLASSSVICILESGLFNCGSAVAENPKAMPVLIVPKLATNDART